MQIIKITYTYCFGYCQSINIVSPYTDIRYHVNIERNGSQRWVKNRPSDNPNKDSIKTTTIDTVRLNQILIANITHPTMTETSHTIKKQVSIAVIGL
jgi:hypothetical protein